MKEEYKIITGTLNSFDDRLNEIVKKGYKPIGNLTTNIYTNNAIRYSILTRKETKINVDENKVIK